MGRIPEDELERIKRETDLVALVRSRGIELKPHGKDLIGTCIFHPDQTPSLVITPGRNLFHCFGCGAAGTAIDWVMRTEGVTFRHAVEILRSGGPQPSPGAPPLKRSQAMKLPAVVDASASDEDLMGQVIAYYHATLETSPEALAYVAKRGIGAPEAIDTFQLGFANRTLGFRLPQKTCDDGIRIRHRLAKLGMLRQTGHEHFTGCLVIPILDAEGHVAGVYGRRIIRNPPAGSPSHLYLPGPHRGVFNLAAFRASKDIILCEALIDALTFYCAGFANVTTSYGVHGFTSEHLEAMKAYGTERVLVAYDRDAAGDAAAAELATKLAAEGITTFRVLFPHGMDANEYACKVKPAAQSLAVLLASATYMAGPTAERPTLDPHPPAHQLAEPPASSLAAAPEPVGEEAQPLDVELTAGEIEPPAAKPTAPPDLTAPAMNIAPPPPEPSPADPDPVPAPASPAPPPPHADIPAEVSETQVVLRLGPRSWRIRGLAKNTSFEQLRVNVFVGLDGAADRFHQDTIDLYSAKQRQAFVKQAAAELGGQEEAIKKDLGTVLLKLEQLQELAITKALEPKKPTITIDDKDRQAAMDLLRDRCLLDRILADFERCGVVGEETNKLVGYLAAVSRKLDRPLAVMVQSSSAAGKSALMNACLAFVPEEERVAYSAMTGQSLFYMAETDLEHKVLAIAEEEGAERASYALKQFQSEGELSIASTGKDPQTGRLVTHEYRVKGPAAIVMTTTAIDLDEELLNRCLVLTVNEDREQTKAIHRMQREAETLEGYLAELDKAALLTLHRNAQRLLRPLRVVNPYARHLTFLDDRTRTRRDHTKYLGLIRAIALLHQHQRPVKTDSRRGTGDGRKDPVQYIEVELSDIEAANRLAHEVLGRTLDELPPQTRRFLLLLGAMATEACAADRVSREEYRFTRADARRATGWSLTQVKAHLDRLCEMEYALIHRGGRGQSFVYELLYAGQGQQGEPFLMGLLDVDTLRGQQRLEYGSDLSAFSPRVSDSEGHMSRSKRPQNGAKTGGCRTAPDPQEANHEAHPGGLAPENDGNTRLGSTKSRSSYVLDRDTPPGPLFAAASGPRRP